MTTATDGHKTFPSQRRVVSNEKIDGLGLNRPVKVTVGAIDGPSLINAKQEQERGLESNGICKVENSSSIVNQN